MQSLHSASPSSGVRSCTSPNGRWLNVPPLSLTKFRTNYGTPVRRASVTTLSASLLNQALLVISGALSARILGPADRGHAALLTLIPSVLAIAGSFGLFPAARHFIARAPSSTVAVLRSLRRDITAQLIGLSACHIVVTVFVLLPSLSGSRPAAAIVALAFVPALVITQYSMSVIQGHQRFGAFSAMLVAPQAFSGVGMLALYITDSGSLTSVVSVLAASAIVTALAATLLARRSVLPKMAGYASPSRSELRRFARKAYFGQVTPIESFRVDQLVVGAALSPAILGYYVTATAFTNLTRAFGSSMGLVLAPYVASLPASEQRRSLSRGLAVTAALCGIVTLGLVPSTELLVPLLFGDPFRPAIPLAQVLLIAGFFLGVRRAAIPGLQGIGYPEIGSYAELYALLAFAVLLPVGLMSSSGLGIAFVFLVSSIAGMGTIAILFRFRTRQADF